jgi:hypothetical protein
MLSIVGGVLIFAVFAWMLFGEERDSGHLTAVLLFMVMIMIFLNTALAADTARKLDLLLNQ